MHGIHCSLPELAKTNVEASQTSLIACAMGGHYLAETVSMKLSWPNG